MARPKNKELWRKHIGEGVTKMTYDYIQKLKDAFAIDCNIKEACSYAGISRQTYHNWIKKNPELLDEFEALRQKIPLRARQTIANSVGDPSHAFRYMQSKRPEEFGSKTKIEYSGRIQTEDMSVSADVAEAVKQYEELRDKQIDEEIGKMP